jgi:outer membrane lipoprotein
MGIFIIFFSTCTSVSVGSKIGAITVSFGNLLEDPEQYVGKNVLLGGYILDARQLPGKTVIEVLQTPLMPVWKEPQFKKYSEGRFKVVHEGELDLKAYVRDRKITVAGKFSGCEGTDGQTCSVEAAELHLWPEMDVNWRNYRYRDAPGGFP